MYYGVIEIMRDRLDCFVLLHACTGGYKCAEHVLEHSDLDWEAYPHMLVEG